MPMGSIEEANGAMQQISLDRAVADAEQQQQQQQPPPQSQPPGSPGGSTHPLGLAPPPSGKLEGPPGAYGAMAHCPHCRTHHL